MHYKIGLGYDIHQLVEGRPLILGGVHIAYSKGLLGHSDADVLTHSIIDALLGSLKLGDIGRLFPDTDAQYKNANSLELLKIAYEKVKAKGYIVGNIDANIIAQAPKLSPYIANIEYSLAQVMAIDIDTISIKAKTNEQLDAVGQGQAIICHTSILVYKLD